MNVSAHLSGGLYFFTCAILKGRLLSVIQTSFRLISVFVILNGPIRSPMRLDMRFSVHTKTSSPIVKFSIETGGIADLRALSTLDFAISVSISAVTC